MHISVHPQPDASEIEREGAPQLQKLEFVGKLRRVRGVSDDVVPCASGTILRTGAELGILRTYLLPPPESVSGLRKQLQGLLAIDRP